MSTTFKMNELRIRLTFINDLLGTMPSDPSIFDNFVVDREKAAKSGLDIEDNVKEEMVAIENGANPENKQITIFPKTENGEPFLFDYQIRGFFKEAAKFLNKVPGTLTSKQKAFLKTVDGMVFIKDRQNVIDLKGCNISYCERPLRASTPQGDRVALSKSEAIPAGSTVEFTVQTMVEEHLKLVLEWLEYGQYHGTGQWRNSGAGRFKYEVLDSKGKVIGGNL